MKQKMSLIILLLFAQLSPAQNTIKLSDFTNLNSILSHELDSLIKNEENSGPDFYEYVVFKIKISIKEDSNSITLHFSKLFNQYELNGEEITHVNFQGANIVAFDIGKQFDTSLIKLQLNIVNEVNRVKIRNKLCSKKDGWIHNREPNYYIVIKENKIVKREKSDW